MRLLWDWKPDSTVRSWVVLRGWMLYGLYVSTKMPSTRFTLVASVNSLNLWYHVLANDFYSWRPQLQRLCEPRQQMHSLCDVRLTRAAERWSMQTAKRSKDADLGSNSVCAPRYPPGLVINESGCNRRGLPNIDVHASQCMTARCHWILFLT